MDDATNAPRRGSGIGYAKLIIASRYELAVARHTIQHRYIIPNNSRLLSQIISLALLQHV